MAAPDEVTVTPLSLDAQTWRGIARAALDVAADLQQCLDAKRAECASLREELRERMGVPTV